MKLTNPQIDNLYEFTRNHYVEWFDLQTELVDHLANDIEAILRHEPNLTFEQAKKKAFKKFGIFGFNDVIGAKQDALFRIYWRLIFKELRSYITPPKILISLGLWLLIYTLLSYNNTIKITSILLLASFIIIPCYYSIKYHILIKRNRKKTKKKFLFENVITQLGGIVLFIQIPIHSLKIVDNQNWIYDNRLWLSGLLMFCTILTFLLSVKIPKIIDQNMAKQFSQYKRIIT